MPSPNPTHLVADGYDGRYRFSGMVFESSDHGPHLCGVVMQFYPPQCSGPDVGGWAWAGLGAESDSGTTWGEFTVVGTWDGERLALTEPPVPPVPITEPAGGPDFATRCPEPDGGWVPPDPDRATDEAMQEAMAAAEATDGYAGAWIDQNNGGAGASEANDNDPQRIVLNVTTAGDVVAMVATFREVWSGALCVSTASRSEAELLAVQQELLAVEQEPGTGYTSLGISVATNALEISTWVATEVDQAALDQRFGAGAVRITGILQPLD